MSKSFLLLFFKKEDFLPLISCFLAIFFLCSAAPALKPPLVGLISMGKGGYRNNNNAQYNAIPGTSLADIVAKRNAFDGVVINVAWARIQPNGPAEFDISSIDGALRQIRDYNSDPRTTVKLRAILRIWAGIAAPMWAKTLGGSAIDVWSNMPRTPVLTVGRFWSPAYRDAWRSLQVRLAERYDPEPLIVQISNTSCTTGDDEPFSLSRNFNAALGMSSVRNLRDAGYTDALFMQCIAQSAEDYTGWKTTYVNLPFNPVLLTDHVGDYQRLSRDAGAAVDLIHQWRAALGARAVLSNQNMSHPLNPNNTEVYQAIRRAGGQIEFQTHAPRGLDWENTVKEAVCLGAHSLELWNDTDIGGYVEQPMSALLRWSDELKHTTSNELCPAGTPR